MADAPAENANAGPGRLLAEARNERDLSREEVGDALNLTAQTVGWLEEDRYDLLPTAAFTQGYLRNYARFVGLEPDTIVAAYQSSADSPPTVAWRSPASPAVNVVEIAQQHPGLLLSGVVAGVAVLALVVLFMVWPESEVERSDAAVAAEAARTVGPERSDTAVSDTVLSDTATALSNNARDSRTRVRGEVERDAPSASPVRRSTAAPAAVATVAEEAARNNDRSPGAGSAAKPPSLPVEAGAAAPVVRAVPAPAAVPPDDGIDPDDPLAHLPIAQTFPVERGSAPSDGGELESGALTATPLQENRLTPFGTDVIGVAFVEESWFEVRDTDDKALYTALGQPGQSLELVGEGPFKVVFGYAHGVELSYNARPVVLTPYIRNNVASLVIGQ